MSQIRSDDEIVSAPASQGRGGLFYGWWVLAAAAALGFCAFGVVIPGYLAFSVPVRAELGLSSGQSAFIVGAAWGVGDITSLAAGWLADRYGARRLVLIGGVLCGVGFAALGFADSFWAIVLAFSVTASVGRGLGIFPTLMTVVNQWFDERKALALATINTAVTAGAAAILPALSLTGELIGWRMAAFVAGGLVFAITLPAAAVIRSRPEDLGLLPLRFGDRRPTTADRRRWASTCGGSAETKLLGQGGAGHAVVLRVGDGGDPEDGAVGRAGDKPDSTVDMEGRRGGTHRHVSFDHVLRHHTGAVRHGFGGDVGIAALDAERRDGDGGAMHRRGPAAARRRGGVVPDPVVGNGTGGEFAGMDHGGRVFRAAQFRDAGRVDDRVLRSKRIDRAGGGRIGVRPDREFCACAAGGRRHAGGIGDGVPAGAEAGC